MATLLSSHCASVGQRVTVTVDQDASIVSQDSSSRGVKKGEPFELDQSPILIEAKGYNSLLVVPRSSDNGSIKADLRRADEWGGELYLDASNKMTAEVVSSVVHSQQLLGSKKTEEALATLDKLQEKYPHISYLHFLRASILVLLGRSQDAQISLEKALADFPDNQDGSNLYKAVTGKAFERAPKEASK